MTLPSSMRGGFPAGPLPDEVEEIELPDPPAEPQLLTIRISLDHSRPPVWRRVTVPGDLPLAEVHDIIQTVMGWDGYHLHRFLVGKPWDSPSFLTDYDLEEGETGTSEYDVRIDQLLRATGDKIRYIYDFGDNWVHTLRLEKLGPIPAPPEGVTAAKAGSAAYAIRCLAGARACPPEDVGGIGGYEEMAEWGRHGYAPEHVPDRGIPAEELRDWLPVDWHPDHFDLRQVNKALAALGPGEADLVLATLPESLRKLVERLPPDDRDEVDAWLDADAWTDALEPLPDAAVALTECFRVVLDVVGDGVTLTGAGYLPPGTVKEIFVRLGLDEEWIGRGSREDQTLPVADLRGAMQDLGLLRKARGTLAPTAKARALRDKPRELLTHVVGRLPLEKGEFGSLAALVSLLAVTGGDGFHGGPGGRRAGTGRVAKILTAAGWRSDRGDAVTASQVRDAAAHTLATLEHMVRGVATDDDARAHAEWIACTVLDGDAANS